MSLFWFFTSRREKVILISEIIGKLNISEEEKELYKLSITVLEDNDFEIFYNKIKNQINANPSTIMPFSNQLI
jgi:hypothetical protein